MPIPIIGERPEPEQVLRDLKEQCRNLHKAMNPESAPLDSEEYAEFMVKMAQEIELAVQWGTLPQARKAEILKQAGKAPNPDKVCLN